MNSEDQELIEIGDWIELEKMLQQFEDLFKETKGLPPHRKCDHKIILKVDAQPISFRPYRYAAIQKNAIEALISDMVQARVIRRSSSTFATPVVLVKKGQLMEVVCGL